MASSRIALIIRCRWEGEDEAEVGKDSATGRVLVRIDPRYYRPTEVDLLLGDASKAALKLRWKPTTRFEVCLSCAARQSMSLIF